MVAGLMWVDSGPKQNQYKSDPTWTRMQLGEANSVLLPGKGQ